uniref:Uncharacterized protein n=1 Tax=Candidatus Methanogaster sp. ANME-2c ERB4 TaxID=2759911 RepID=A0A7G9Y1E9_9EURY|nr:hypothetical protein ADJAJEDA_00002 [Methanosarcinales archaeon ANME-2c ERB4]
MITSKPRPNSPSSIPSASGVVARMSACSLIDFRIITARTDFRAHVSSSAILSLNTEMPRFAASDAAPISSSVNAVTCSCSPGDCGLSGSCGTSASTSCTSCNAASSEMVSAVAAVSATSAASVPVFAPSVNRASSRLASSETSTSLTSLASIASIMISSVSKQSKSASTVADVASATPWRIASSTFSIRCVSVFTFV